MGIEKIFKKLSLIFYFLVGLTTIIFVVLSVGARGEFPKASGLFIIFGVIFLFLGFVFSSVASILIDRKSKNQSSDSSHDVSIYLESKESSKKMFKIGFFAFVGVGFMLVSSVVIFFDGRGDNLEIPFFILLVIFSLTGVVSWILAIMRYFRKQ